MQRRKTKIVATIADNRCEVSFIKSLYEAGMNVVRINSAHVSLESASQVVKNVRAVSDKIAILIDTKGPEIRTTKCVNDGFEVKAGDFIPVCGGCELSSPDMLYVSYQNIVNSIDVGTALLVDDGDIKLVIVEKQENRLIARVENSGKIKNRKSVNIPNMSLDLESVTEKDKDFILWAIDEKIDFIAHSFVRRKEDVIAVQNILDEHNSEIKIISKIENIEGVDKIDEILEYTYGVMIARGDLGVEMPAEQIPWTQQALVRKCVERKKPVIIATQMLQSMINNPRPTRAEVSDISSAIFQRTDAIMLSGETANGDYPIEAVETMHRVAMETEKHTRTIIDINLVHVQNDVAAHLAKSAVRSCETLSVRAIIIDTLSGRTGRYLSAFRGLKPVFTICYKKHVMRELALSYGIFADYQEPTSAIRDFMRRELDVLLDDTSINPEDLIAVVGGDYGAEHGASFLEISKVGDLLNKLKTLDCNRTLREE